MQIKTLYLPLKTTSGRLITHKWLDFKVRQHLEKYGRLPKWTPKGYYRSVSTPDTELQSHIDRLEASVLKRLDWLLKFAPHIVSVLAK